MSAVVVRYELDPERLVEHLELIEGVFEHLRRSTPEGVHYGVLRSADGTAFTHIAIYDDAAAREAASNNEAFQAFVADIADRCLVPPAAEEQVVVESYGIFFA